MVHRETEEAQRSINVAMLQAHAATTADGPTGTTRPSRASTGARVLSGARNALSQARPDRPTYLSNERNTVAFRHRAKDHIAPPSLPGDEREDRIAAALVCSEICD